MAAFEVLVGQTPPSPTPTPTSTPPPTPTPTPTPAATPAFTPTPVGVVIETTLRSYRIGEPVRIGGRAPEGTYCAAVVVNGVWAIGDPAPDGIVSSVTVTSLGGVIPESEVWVAQALGLYDVLLLSDTCGAPGATILAACEASSAAGFGVGADPIPTASRAGWLMLVALVAVLGAWMLWVRRG